MPRLQHVADECRAHVELCPGTRLRARDNREYHTEKLRGRMVGAPFRVEKRTLYKLIGMHNDLLASNQERHDLHRNVPAPAIVAGRGRMVGLRSGRFDWTVQVGYLPTSAHGKRRKKTCSGESDPTDNGILQKKKNIADAKQRSTPILGLDLNSGLGLKGLNEQVEEPYVGEILQECAESGRTLENLARNTDSTSIATVFSDSRSAYFSPHGTSRTLDHCVGPIGIHHIVGD